MHTVHLLYPALAMFLLTMACIFLLGIARYRAIHKREVSIAYFQSYNQGTQPQRLHILARHVQNHFEVPPLFYTGIILTFITANTSYAALIFAWLFVAARLVHTFIHLGKNNVSARFFTFGFSLLMLSGLWLTLIYQLIAR